MEYSIELKRLGERRIRGKSWRFPLLYESMIESRILSKYRTQLMGIATLAVLLLHFTVYNVQLQQIKLIYLCGAGFGAAGVDIFIILSAIGLYFSLSQNSNYSSFLKRRVIRVIIPYLVMAIPLWCLIDFRTAWSHISTWHFWAHGNDGTWYIPFILLMYLVYPLLFKYVLKSNVRTIGLTIMACVIIIILDLFFQVEVEQYGIAIGRIPAIILGGYIGKHTYENKKIPRLFMFAMLCGTLLKYVGSIPFAVNSIMKDYVLVTSRSIILLFFVAWIYNMVINKLKLIDALLLWIGRYSLEIYILHMLLMKLIQTYFEISDLYAYLFGVCLTFFVAPLVGRVAKTVTDRLKIISE